MTPLKKIVAHILIWEARLVLLRYKPRIIAITGSVGKTTTKDAIFAALTHTLDVRKSAKSFNSEIGVPLTILGLENAWNNPIAWIKNIIQGLFIAVVPHQYPDWLVLEVGADRPGDIKRIAQWLRPDIAVFTGVPDIPAHIEYFSSPEEVMKEKRALAEYIKPGGTLVVNGDDSRSKKLHSDFRAMCIRYGLDQENDYFASHDEILYQDDEPTGIRFRSNHGASSIPISLHGALGKPRMYAALAAIAVSEIVGVDGVSVGQALATWEPTPGRLRIVPGVKYSVILDDTYNSSPVAALAAIDVLDAMPSKGKKIAIMGDMLELGRYTKEAHKKVGERAANMCDLLFTIGFRSKSIAEAAIESGMNAAMVRQYDNGEGERVVRELIPDLQKGDIVLVKGSQGMRLEKVVKALMREPEKAQDYLVRMDEEWQHR